MHTVIYKYEYLLFIFTAKDVNQAYNRLKYIQQYEDYKGWYFRDIYFYSIHIFLMRELDQFVDYLSAIVNSHNRLVCYNFTFLNQIFV